MNKIDVLFGIFQSKLLAILSSDSPESRSAPFLNVVRQFLKDNGITSSVFANVVEEHSDQLANFIESGELSTEELNFLFEKVEAGTA